MEYQRIGAAVVAAWLLVLCASASSVHGRDEVIVSWCVRGVLGGCVERGWVVVIVVVVFGTLLGPEITGLLLHRGVVSWWVRVPVFPCGGFLRRRVGRGACRRRVWFPVGWGACCFWFPAQAGRCFP